MGSETGLSIVALHGMLGRPDDWRILEELPGVRMKYDAPDLFSDRWAVDFNSIGVAINTSTSGDILLGYSLGGRLAMHALIADPNRWKAAVIVSGNTGLDEEQRDSRLAADRLWAEKARSGDWAEFLKEWDAQRVFGGRSVSAEADRVGVEPLRESIATAFDRWSLGRQRQLLPEMERVGIPVLWMTGEEDLKFRNIADAACARLQPSRHVVVPDCGHRVPWENPGEFKRALADFLLQLKGDD